MRSEIVLGCELDMGVGFLRSRSRFLSLGVLSLSLSLGFELWVVILQLRAGPARQLSVRVWVVARV